MLAKKVWTTFWAIFSQTHMVTLVVTEVNRAGLDKGFLYKDGILHNRRFDNNNLVIYECEFYWFVIVCFSSIQLHKGGAISGQPNLEKLDSNFVTAANRNASNLFCNFLSAKKLRSQLCNVAEKKCDDRQGCQIFMDTIFQNRQK
jgi:hypothetical protein